MRKVSLISLERENIFMLVVVLYILLFTSDTGNDRRNPTHGIKDVSAYCT
jgi:hypothetical protein